MAAAQGASAKLQCPHGRPRTPVTGLEGGYREGRTDGPASCRWAPGTKEANPHTCHRVVRPKILNTVLDAVGNTPLVRLNRIPADEGVECEICVKAEYFNAGGSVKDRIGLRMIEDAEKAGRIKPGDTLIEPTSGNTGIGLALAAAIKGYRMVITLPEKMSQEKVDVLKALGAEIIRTPTEAAFDSPESHIGVALRLNAEIPNSHILDQYYNPGNPLAHYDGTAEEIWEDCEGKVDMVVVGAGTGGTLTGIARKLKERNPDLIVIGVDPRGSILAEPESLNDDGRLVGYQVEGTGYDFIPTVLDRDVVDEWIKTTDEDSFVTSRRLIRQEGILCGGSSGANVWAAVQMAKKYGLGKGKRVVTILPDSVRNYMTKFLSDDWMWRQGIVAPEYGVGVEDKSVRGGDKWWMARRVADLEPKTPITVEPTVTCEEAVHILEAEGFDQLPVVGEDGTIMGVVTEGNLAAKLTSGRLQPADSVTKALFRQFRQVSPSTGLGELARVFDSDHFALVTTTQRAYSSKSKAAEERTMIFGVVSRIDLVKYITTGEAAADTPTVAAAAGGAAGQ